MLKYFLLLVYCIYCSICNVLHPNNEMKTQILLKRNNNEELLSLLKDFINVLENQKDFFPQTNSSILMIKI